MNLAKERKAADKLSLFILRGFPTSFGYLANFAELTKLVGAPCMSTPTLSALMVLQMDQEHLVLFCIPSQCKKYMCNEPQNNVVKQANHGTCAGGSADKVVVYESADRRIW